MILGIDASNLRAGGGVTHLVELLRAASPQQQGFSRVLYKQNILKIEEILAKPEQYGYDEMFVLVDRFTLDPEDEDDGREEE